MLAINVNNFGLGSSTHVVEWQLSPDLPLNNLQHSSADIFHRQAYLATRSPAVARFGRPHCRHSKVYKCEHNFLLTNTTCERKLSATSSKYY